MGSDVDILQHVEFWKPTPEFESAEAHDEISKNEEVELTYREVLSRREAEQLFKEVFPAHTLTQILKPLYDNQFVFKGSIGFYPTLGANPNLRINALIIEGEVSKEHISKRGLDTYAYSIKLSVEPTRSRIFIKSLKANPDNTNLGGSWLLQDAVLKLSAALALPVETRCAWDGSWMWAVSGFQPLNADAARELAGSYLLPNLERYKEQIPGAAYKKLKNLMERLHRHPENLRTIAITREPKVMTPDDGMQSLGRALLRLPKDRVWAGIRSPQATDAVSVRQSGAVSPQMLPVQTIREKLREFGILVADAEEHLAGHLHNFTQQLKQQAAKARAKGTTQDTPDGPKR